MLSKAIYRSFLCIVAGAYLGTVFGEEQISITADDLVIAPASPPGYLTPATQLTKECRLAEGEPTASMTKVVVFRVVPCATSKYSEEVFYEFAAQGKTYFVRKRNLTLTDDEIRKVEALQDVPGIRELAITASETLASRLVEELRVAEAAVVAEWKAKKDAYKKELDSKKKYGLGIVEVGVEENEYTDSTLFGVRVVNPTSKPIKYISIFFTGYNSVGDPVFDRIKGKSRMQVRAIGPIQPGERGEYVWKHMWFNKLVTDFKIHEIRVEYMDRSVKVIKGADWKALVLEPAIVEAGDGA